jgi:acetoin utilization deacetylase AcuC-like enzyme
MARLLHDAANRFCDGRWVATGGGGYQFDSVVPKVWTIHFAEMCGASDAIPEEWLDDRAPEDVSRSYTAEVERTVRHVLEECLPRISNLVPT